MKDLADFLMILICFVLIFISVGAFIYSIAESNPGILVPIDKTTEPMFVYEHALKDIEIIEDLEKIDEVIESLTL